MASTPLFGKFCFVIPSFLSRFLMLVFLVGSFESFSQTTITFTTPGTTTWTVPPCVYSITVEVWGGGGGGGGASSNQNTGGDEACSQGGGGGGGGFAGRTYAVVPGEVYTIVVGAGGSAGIAVGTNLSDTPAHIITGNAANNGGNGGTSTFTGPATIPFGSLTGFGGLLGGGAWSRNQSNGFTGHIGTDGTAGTGATGANGTSIFTGGNGSSGRHSASCYDASGAGGGGAGNSANGGNASAPNSCTLRTGGAGGNASGGAGADGKKLTSYSASRQATAGSVGALIGGGGSGGMIHLHSWPNQWTLANGGAGARGEVRITYNTGAQPTPTFAAVPSQCVGSTPPILPTTSTNAITGTWAPAVSTASTGTTVYTFTPDPSQCANTATLSFTVTSGTTPTFAALASQCIGSTPPVLPTTSTNGITGTWVPAVSTVSAGTTTYTFTPATGQCANSTTLSFTVTSGITPTFSSVGPLCQGSAAPTLPTTSTNGITGTWSPAVSTASLGTTTYTFTPSTGQCATSTTMNITIGLATTPTFAAVASQCVGSTAPTLPTTSTNGINGSWSPSVSTAAAGTTTYTFTPTVGQCATTTTLSFTVTAPITPTFAAVAPLCQGSAAPTLPATSTNGINGTWSPAVSTTSAGTTSYTFSPTAGQCANNATMNITIDPATTPTFAVVAAQCIGSTPPVFPSTSTNGITGSWSPAVSTATAGTTTYTFTPTTGQCATTTTLAFTVTSGTTPTFVAVGPLCQGSAAPTLPTTSTNGINGSWSPAVSTASVGTTTYTFTPTAGQCANNATLNIVINIGTTPTFSAIASQCVGSTPPLLPLTSTNGFTGTWSPSVSTASAGTTTYTFTPTMGQCATTTTLSFTVTAPITPTFAAVAPLCQGSTAPTLPTNSINGITGTWAPTVSTVNTGTSTYTFTPTAGQCANNATINITINPATTPTFAIVAAQCIGSTPPVFPLTSTNGITGSWSPTVSTATAGTTTYTFTPTTGQCATTTTLSFSIDPATTPTFAAVPSQCINATPPVLPTTSTNGITGSWSPVVSTATAGTTTYTFTPDAGQCANNSTLTISVGSATIPLFSSVPSQCAGTVAPIFPTTSINGFIGAWSPAVSTINAGTTTYTFTPDAGQCASAATLDFTVSPIVNPTFASLSDLCIGSTAPTLSTTSLNGITGTWNSVPNSSVAGNFNFSFSPDAGQCASSTTLSFVVNSLPLISAGPDQTICANENATITATGGVNYSWNSGLPNGSSQTVAPTSTTSYTVIGTDANGCTSNDEITITVTNTLQVGAGIDVALCEGQTLTLSGSGANQYSWNNNVTNGVPFSPSIGSSTYIVTGTSAGGCTNTDTVTVLVHPKPIVQFSANQLTACVGGEIVFTNNSLNSVDCQWNVSNAFSSSDCGPFTVSFGSPGYYNVSLTVTDINGCTNTLTNNQMIEIIPNPVADFTASTYEINNFNSNVSFTNLSSNATSYSWNFGDNSPESNVTNPAHTFPYDAITNYVVTLYAFNAAGCPDSIQQVITFIDEVIIYVPNTFTPDNDEYNQSFQPVITSGFDPMDYNMMIFNRWGELIFETRNIEFGWDGTYNNNICQDGTYTWKIEFKALTNDDRKMYVGHVNVLR